MVWSKSPDVSALSGPRPTARLRAAGRRMARTLRRLRHQRMGDRAVTPVIGSIMILGITVMGIAGVMLWGGPALQRVQEQGAQAAMLGEFQEIRRDSLVLSITDASRVPRVSLEAGEFGMREGTRIQITSMFDAGCDFHVYDWGKAASDQVKVTSQGCGDTTLKVHRNTGGNTPEVHTQALPEAAAGAPTTITVPGQDFTTRDWMFQIEDGGVLAQAWLMSTNAVYWELKGASEVGLQLEGGALYSSRDGTQFLEAPPRLNEQEAGNPNDFVVKLPTFSGSLNTHSGRSTPSLFMALVGSNLRVSEDVVHKLRFDFEGDHAEAWCNTLMLRNSRFDADRYAEDPDFPCDQAITGHRSVGYTTGGTFQFEFIHVRITTSL